MSNATVQAVNPATGKAHETSYEVSSPKQIRHAAEAAGRAFGPFSAMQARGRAAFLRAIADELESVRDEIVALVPRETALPAARAGGELGRTMGQLRMFADLIEEGSWVDARIERAKPDREPLPKPDVRSMLIPLGPVAVFGASNFPLAFSVAGGDTASALAAGCPVVAVAHWAHPGTSQVVANTILRAADKTGMPDGVFSLLQGTGQQVGVPLVKHPAIRAVGFTGSRRGGLALADVAAARPEPIPVFAEMSSINPVVLLPGAASGRAAAIAKGLAGSVTLGAGQFCTNPGLVFVPQDTADAFAKELSAALADVKGGTALHRGIAESFAASVAARTGRDDLEIVVGAAGSDSAGGQDDGGASMAPFVFKTTLEAFAADSRLAEEAFGPATTLVTYTSLDALADVIRRMEGQLTGTIHYDESDRPLSETLVSALRSRVGRLLLNSFPTGVEVCSAMVHGGPYPATSDGRETAVGTAAIFRWTRRFCWQDMVEEALPLELRDANPLGIARRMDGKMT
ncbi:MAG: aldehyde dehydrogenase (NADP(+)) [Bacteroidetes bacterium CG12_big_fil_rev_8_21_14_0_65_60_17]|nr:MAG: aldehyde dehydrogenase (NADP(+)) [Bacteroidetes bacterium CG12_big_fil_rev_8_21_14_0_65_60_17]